MSDGSMKAIVYSEPVHYKDGNELPEYDDKFDDSVLGYGKNDSQMRKRDDNYRNVNTHDKEKRYLLGITTNNKGTKTILSVMNYSDKYYVFEDQVEPITYINTIETNSYYKNKGLYKSLVKNMIRFINPNQHILTTLESDEGKLCSTHKILCEILKENGFNKTINVLGRVNVEEYHNLLTQNKKLTL